MKVDVDFDPVDSTTRQAIIFTKESHMSKVTPFLWFDGQAEEAAKFYTSIFKNSRIESMSPMSATFHLDGQKFMALNGGPQFMFTEAISFFVNCETQTEVDELWRIVVPEWAEMLRDQDPQRSERVMAATLQMSKPDIKQVTRANAAK